MGFHRNFDEKYKKIFFTIFVFLFRLKKKHFVINMVNPPCKWAERDDKVILTVDVRNVPKDAKVDLKDNTVFVEYSMFFCWW